jgi:2-methylisocitrate lyase-like PEP mutase family enzyme
MDPLPRETVEAANAQSRHLRELLHAPEILVMPGAFDVLSALLFQHLGFAAIQGSSAGFANAMGHADLEIGREATVAFTRRVVEAVAIPVNADGEDGFGGPEEVHETVRRLIEIGAAGMNLEDSLHEAGARGLVPVQQQLEKIAAFLDTRRALGSEFLLNARVDTYGVIRDDPKAALADALFRGQAYVEAGADSIFFVAVTDRDAIRTLAKEIPAPISVFGFPGGANARELEELGVARVSYGSAFLRVAAGAVKRFAEEILRDGTHDLLNEALPGADLRAILAERRP